MHPENTMHVKSNKSRWWKHGDEFEVCNNDDFTWHAIKWLEITWNDMTYDQSIL